jgi:hypothetical protein
LAVPVRDDTAPRDLDGKRSTAVSPSSPNHPTTPLSSGSLNGQTLKIELVEPANDLPNAVVVRWPQKPTITSPVTFDQVVANAMKILANASVELAALRVWKGL